jgi:hypothetical protein
MVPRAPLEMDTPGFGVAVVVGVGLALGSIAAGILIKRALEHNDPLAVALRTAPLNDEPLRDDDESAISRARLDYERGATRSLTEIRTRTRVSTGAT